MSTFEPLHDAEQKWLAEQINASFQFAGVSAAENECAPNLELLDVAFAHFLNRVQDAEEANRVLTLVGVAFGAHLVSRLGFEWGYATDDWGAGLAVRARPGRGDVTIFPIDFVSKRYENRDTPFLVGSLGAIEESLRKIDREWESKP